MSKQATLSSEDIKRLSAIKKAIQNKNTSPEDVDALLTQLEGDKKFLINSPVDVDTARILRVNPLCRKVNNAQTLLYWAIYSWGNQILSSDGHEHKAINENFKAKVEQLLAHGAEINIAIDKPASYNLNSKEVKDETALCCAVIFGNFPAVELLLSKKAGIGVSDENGTTLFHNAVLNRRHRTSRGNENQKAIIECLLKCEPEGINMPDKQGKTPLLYMLSSLSESIGSFDDYFSSPIHAHAYDDFIKVKRKIYETKTMLEPVLKASNINVANEHGITPLNYIFSSLSQTIKEENRGSNLYNGQIKEYKSIIDSLLAIEGVEINVPNKDGQTPWGMAQASKNEDIIRLLSKKIEAPTLFEAIKNAITSEDEAGVKALLGGFKDNKETLIQALNMRGVDGQTLLHLAVVYKNQTIAQSLLENRSGVDLLNNKNQTPLLWAVASRNEAMVKLLLSCGANVNAVEKDGYTPFDMARASQNEKIIHLFTEHVNRQGALEPLKESKKYLSNDEGKALERKNLTSSRQTLFDEINKIVGKGDQKALEDCLKAQNVEDIKNVINAYDVEGQRPLHHAAAFGNAAVVQSLLNHGAEINVANKSDWTPLHWAAARGKVEMMGLLLSNGANIDAADDEGKTPLFRAAAKGSVEAVQLLLENDAVLNACTDEQTPLHEAASSGSTAVVNLLLERKGGDVNARDSANRTPLHWAAASGHAEVIELLLGQGGNINAIDNGGKTPLHFAAAKGSAGAVQLLLKRGANINAPDNKGKTVLDGVSSNREVSNLLTKAMADEAEVSSSNLGHDTPQSLKKPKITDRIFKFFGRVALPSSIKKIILTLFAKEKLKTTSDVDQPFPIGSNNQNKLIPGSNNKKGEGAQVPLNSGETMLSAMPGSGSKQVPSSLRSNRKLKLK